MNFSVKTLKGDELDVFSIWSGYGRTDLDVGDAYALNLGCVYHKKKPNDIKICTGFYRTKKTSDEDNYISMEFAQVICKLGFDGWVIGDTYQRAGSTYGFHAELLLCKAKELTRMLPAEHCSKYVSKSTT